METTIATKRAKSFGDKWRMCTAMIRDRECFEYRLGKMTEYESRNGFNFKWPMSSECLCNSLD